MKNRTITWSALYDRHIEEINADLIDILRSHIDNETDEIIDEKDKEPFEDNDGDEFWLDWMLLAGIGSNAIIDYSSDLGLWDMDQNHD